MQLSEKELAEADALQKGFQPQYWNLLQGVRTYLLLLVPSMDPEEYKNIFNKLQETADLDEQVTLYSALPILPYPNAFIKQTAEGIRTNITHVFDAIALNNPFPAKYLDEPAWNQMVLKAVFMQRPLYRIYGADERVNPDLAGMLIDFAHERWAANRMVLPELWRFVGPFLSNNYLTDIEKVINGDALEKKAGLLACAHSNLPEAQRLLNQFPVIKKDIESGKLNWTEIGKKYQRVLQE
ncbi:MAG: EboA domain-containing protein [Christiangramia sp.]|nr:EboA domain-containing protein [Christiangramia sp.]